MMELQIGFQSVFLDFAIVFGDSVLVYSIYDRSAINLRSMAAQATWDRAYIDGKAYSLYRDYNRKGGGLKHKRYIERYECGRDRISTALIVSELVNDSVIITDEEHKLADIYSFLMKKYSLPLLPEWTSYILEKAKESYVVIETDHEWNNVVTENPERKIDLGSGEISLEDIKIIKFDMSEQVLRTIVSEGLFYKRIRITDKEMKPLEFNNLDEYYQRYGDSIVGNLQKLLVPLTEENGYCGDYVVTRNKRLLPGQGNGINALAARLENAKYAIANMDMGTGKTLQALSTMDYYFNKKYMKRTGSSLADVIKDDSVDYVAAVMCPSHLVEKWVAEADEIANMNAVAVTSFEQLVTINNRREHYKKGKHLFVFSKDFAKLGSSIAPIPTKILERKPYYEFCSNCRHERGKYVYRKFGERKCSECGCEEFESRVIYDAVAIETYICPYCGKPLLRNGIVNRTTLPTCLGVNDFASPTSANKICYHCNSQLWGVQPKNIGSSSYAYKWNKIGYFTTKNHKTSSTAWVFDKRCKDFVESKKLDSDEWWESNKLGSRKYSPALYIKKHMKGFFDFFIADEAHMYESNSAQGHAFGVFVNVSKKVLALTGTLTNGYARGLFNLFWKLDPGRMVANGYEFKGEDGVNKWSSIYGVMEKREKVEETKYNTSSRGGGNGTFHERPGVSPQITKDFLLETTVQLQLADLSDGLPPLEEKVISVELDKGVGNSLTTVTGDLKKFARDEKCAGANAIALQYQLFYPDRPYACKPILNPLERGEIITIADSHYELIRDNGLLNKEKELIKVINSELSEGRSCYVYIENTGSTGDFYLLDRTKEVIENNVPGSKVLILKAETVSATKRESWLKTQVEKYGYNVVISNPRLVETGIDFIWKSNAGTVFNIPTLLFYQCEWSLSTLWQASKRHYRLIQQEECRTYYFVYEGTLQLECIEMMAAKQVAVSAIQGGEFSARGLASMAKGIDPKVELARRLATGEFSDANKVQEMFKSLSLSGVHEWNCAKNVLIREIIGKELESKTPEVEFDFDFSLWAMDPDESDESGSCEKKKKQNKKSGRKEKTIEGQIMFFDLFG